MKLDKKKNKSLDKLVAVYLVASFSYHKLNESIVSDEAFDQVCRRLLANHDSITHQHKNFLDKGALKAGSGFHIKNYPTIVRVVGNSMVEKVLDDWN